MAYYLALNKKNLSRLSYHVIWGLRLDVPGARTLYQDAKFLHRNKVERLKRLHAVEAIRLRPGLWGALVRGFCWVFNWNHYRVHYYQLNAYFSLRLFKKGINMLSNQEQQDAELAGGFKVAPTTENQSLIATVFNDGKTVVWNSGAWLSNKVYTLFVPQPHLQSVNLNITKTHFIVTEPMLKALQLLEIKAKVGEWVTHAALKAAYHKSSLKTHPDKGGTREQFTQIKDAYDEILALIKQASHPSGIWAELERFFEAQDERIAAIKEDQQGLKEEVRQLGKKIDENQQNLDENQQNLDQLQQNLDENQQNLDQLQQNLDENQQNIDQSKKDLKYDIEVKDALAERIARLNAMTEGEEEDALENTSGIERTYSSDSAHSVSFQAEHPNRLFTHSPKFDSPQSDLVETEALTQERHCH